ncbi:MAG: Hsp70 family protein [Desulfuromonadales bacterium]
MSITRFAIGIDLGTTNSALAWVDLQGSDAEKIVSGILDIPQLTGPGVVESLPLLPSFLYIPHKDELAPGELSLPWASDQDYVVGEFARVRGATTPIRLVSSAKSWLCHSGVDRRISILPPDAPEEVAIISPVDASTRYLSHLRMAWDHAHPDAPIHLQDVTVTIPASFDPSARSLTLEAARAAGFGPVTLLEEPQAALYSWISGSDGNWRKAVKPGDVILVIDVGGGTSDFSLIAVTEQEGNLELHRVAVGDHILLGGDNMDLTLAYVVARKLSEAGTDIDPWQLRALTYACRSAKERFLADANAETMPIVIHSRGSKLIGGTLRTELTAAEVRRVILEGFFPKIHAAARPINSLRSGLAQIGLPYAQDTAVTRHLAELLGRHLGATVDLCRYGNAPPVGINFLHPSAVLFNGGVFKSEVLVERTVATLDSWLAAEQGSPVRVLDGADLDLAAARGAAYYGFVRRGKGVRIHGGTAFSYYVEVESAMPAIPGQGSHVLVLCVAPFGMEEGSSAEQAKEFGLRVGEPVHLRFFSSSVRRHDEIGTTLYFWQSDELQELGRIDLTLPVEGFEIGEVVGVRLCSCATETGTLTLTAISVKKSDLRWKIEFDAHHGRRGFDRPMRRV